MISSSITLMVSMAVSQVFWQKVKNDWRSLLVEEIQAVNVTLIDGIIFGNNMNLILLAK